jgi:hypothetical protein
MRTYIFTKRERKVVKVFLDGKIRISDPALWQIRSRIKTFGTLSLDVDAYIRLREAETTTST